MKGNSKNAWKAATDLLAGFTGHHKKATSGHLRKDDGSLTSTDEEKNEVNAGYFGKEIFGRESEYEQEAVDNIDQRETRDDLGHCPTFEEFIQALERAKKDKSPGPNGIPIEMYQGLSKIAKRKVYTMISQYWLDPNYEVDDWHKVDLVLLKKTGDPTQPKNYRPIALLDVLAKVISSIIAKRLDGHLHRVGLQEQAGFTSQRGCVDATATLKIALQNLHVANQDAYVLFVDLVKAFDSVNREMLWKILYKYGLPKTLISVIKKMYTDIEITLQSGDASRSFPSTSGVKQGDNLAPILFLFVVQAASENMDKKWTFARPNLSILKSGRMNGPREKSKNKLSKLDFNKGFYADDAAFVFLNKTDIIEGSKLVANEFSRLGMTVHLGVRGMDGKADTKSKTEAVFFPSRSNEDLDPVAREDFDVGNGRFISFCSVFQYLGTLISDDLKDDIDVQARIRKARAGFAMMKPILLNRRLSLKLRVQLYLQIPLNIALWGCDSWALKEDHLRQLRRFHHDSIRALLGFKRIWHKERSIKMAELRERAGLPTMEQLVTDRTLGFLKKVALMPETRLTRCMLHSQADAEGNGQLKPGAPATTKAWYVRCLRNGDKEGNKVVTLF